MPIRCGWSGRAGQLPQRRDYLGATIGLRQEYAAGGQIVVFNSHTARRRNDLDRGPAVPNIPGKLSIVH
jgi:hypothetical protein